MHPVLAEKAEFIDEEEDGVIGTTSLLNPRRCGEVEKEEDEAARSAIVSDDRGGR